MPNGHGGAPFLASPILLAIVFAALVALSPGGWAWSALSLIVAAAAGWRLAYHLHLREADEYGGAYTSADAYQRALRRYRIAAAVYGVLAVAAGFAVLRWRGLV
jgi:hypothetical protein